MKRRTLRGQAIEGEVKRLIVDDGRLNHGYKVVKFICSTDVTQTTPSNVAATLSLDFDALPGWNWSDNRQIAWASTTTYSQSEAGPPFTLVDPDHVVIMDLYIQGQVFSAGTGDVFNYYIELEPVELSNDETILQLIKERSQDDLR
jgi:hypothetical protein